ncbi:MAG: tetratricopeptide repeat protein [Burkholderiales bacterium]|nr:tetratricopeptide repeat protein [Burkholderiales bacterium]
MFDSIQQALASAVQLHQAGDFASAESICRDILQHHPLQPDALHLLGTMALRHGQFEHAALLISQAIGINKKNPSYHLNLGHVFRSQGKWDEAAKHYGMALRWKPDFADAHLCLGTVYFEQAEFEKSIKQLKSAVALNESAIAHYNLGNAYLKAKNPTSAIHHFTKAIALNGGLPQAYLNLGEALYLIDDLEGARRQFNKVLELTPNAAGAHVGLGNLCFLENDIGQAMHHFQRAIALQPDLAMAHLNLAHCLLKIGNFQDGWKEYEWRLQMMRPAVSHIPRWDGEPLDGKRLLVVAEQGIGDKIQFVRYLSLLQEQAGGQIVFACDRALSKLFASIARYSTIIDIEKVKDLQAVDLHINLLSLPYLFKTNAKTIPNCAAYLHADAELARQWQQRLSKDENFKVGLAWAGNPANSHDRYRSLSLDCFSPLAEIPGVSFYSLQKWMGKKAPTVPTALPLLDFTNELKDFADTAAFMDNMDLVISVDTSIVHLAGALGKPVWTLLHLSADWRYLMEGGSCTWYPSMRLFRQAKLGDWRGVIDRLVPALHERLRQHAVSSRIR